MLETVNPPARQDAGSDEAPMPLTATKRGERSWTDGDDALASLTLEGALADVHLDELAGALTSHKEKQFSIPLLFDYCDTTRRTSYRLGDAIGDLSTGRSTSSASWIEVDPRMSLKRAVELYGEDLLAFEKVVRRISIEMVVVTRQQREQVLRILIRRPASAT